MKSAFLIGSLFLLHFSFLHAEGTAPVDSTYTIKGKVEGLPDGWIWLYHRQTDKQVDSARVQDGCEI